MDNKNAYLFLLGGHDLEMIEIRNILDHEKLPYIDRNLKWGARLSEYNDMVYSEDIIPVGIELIRDITPPENYIEIDHHNDKPAFPSSIEQIATLLNIELSFYQKLIAANDRGYIPAMIEMGASPDQIMEIRLEDRKAQGVTEADEILAEKSIQSNLKVESDITIIEAETKKFSAITDRRFGLDKKLLIFTSDNLCFYGPGVKLLTGKFAELIRQNKAYTGGGPAGFFGIPENVFSPEGIKNIFIPEIIKIVSHG